MTGEVLKAKRQALEVYLGSIVAGSVDACKIVYAFMSSKL